jgi:hypothetical protein
MPGGVTLALSGDQHEFLRRHLFPGDRNEAAALLLCGRRNDDRRQRLAVRDICEIPYAECSVRAPIRVSWSPDYIVPWLEDAEAEGLSVIKVHSHPTCFSTFSTLDDIGDERLLPMLRGWIDADVSVGSAVMLPDGQTFGRVLRSAAGFEPIECISVAGNDLHFWYAGAKADLPDFTASHSQAFDEGTIERLRRLWIAVVGASGTGSPVVEQLMRLGVGVLVIVDDDRMEGRNVNRI